MSTGKRNREKRYHLLGWVLFIVCAGFFITSAIKADDIWGLSGSIVFLIGCVLFIIPLVTEGQQDEDGQN